MPRAWARVQTYDPNLPIRGRYLALQLTVELDRSGENLRQSPNTPESKNPCYYTGKLFANDHKLAAVFSNDGDGVDLVSCGSGRPDQITVMEPVLFFLPENARDPLQTARGGELWAEVTVPTSGPPRPIRLAVKRADTFSIIESK